MAWPRATELASCGFDRDWAVVSLGGDGEWELGGGSFRVGEMEDMSSVSGAAWLGGSLVEVSILSGLWSREAPSCPDNLADNRRLRTVGG
jgi:hypothetical protein